MKAERILRRVSLSAGLQASSSHRRRVSEIAEVNGMTDGRMVARRVRVSPLAICVGSALLVVAGLGLTVGYAISRSSAVCPKCLQAASMMEKTVFGVLVYRKTTLLNGDGHLTPADASRADMCKQIVGHPCSHEYVRTWTGTTSGRWFFRIHSDGGSTKWRLVQPWVEATGALYQAFVRTKARQDAAAVYAMIAESYADLGRNACLRLAADYVADAGDAADEEILTSVNASFQGDAEMDRMARRVLLLRWLAQRLQTVETAEDFKAACAELTELHSETAQ